ncbi:hypothetical protein KUTeg_016101 [Tegillarca granosa]|uniref:Mannosyltransferase n=1 Tax=Tegillarca granosa TaxID=220873 RepID=A0ABQ9EJX3_TEGGR|nr:hypothetical protein KUTeg_016101 [Tegillarca granosa]
MTKEGKGTATIRRRKLKHRHGDMDKAKTNAQNLTEEDDHHEVDEEEEGYLFDEEVLGTSIVQKIMASEKTILLGLIAFRVTNALLIQTQFVPDEYWQSLEVAHNMVFGYGYMTWEWREGLRGYLYPSLIALLYKILAIFHLDYRILLVSVYQGYFQGVLAAYGDLYLFKLSCKLTDRATAQWTLLCQTLSWFMIYCSTRTLTNSTETVLITVALSSTSKFLLFVSLSVLIRPTAAVMWILMCSWHLQQSKQNMILMKTLKQYVFVGLSSFVVSLLLDCGFYGDWIFVQYNFLKFNFLQGGGSFYGTHPWHWYITQGFPVIMGTHLFPFVMGVWKARNKALVFLIVWMIFIYSFLSHKEFRFIMPVLPLSMHYCGVYFQTLSKKPRLKKKKIKASDTKNYEQETSLSNSSSSQSLESSIDSTET